MTVIAQTKYELLPVGEYGALVESVEPVPGQYGNQLKVRFAIRAPVDYAGHVLIGWCSATFSPKSKLYNWTQAIAFDGGVIPEDYDLDTSHLLARPCRLTVITKQGSDGTEINKIEAIKPYRKPAPTKPATGQPKAPPVPVADGWPGDEEEIPF
jgi:hypothetical protein